MKTDINLAQKTKAEKKFLGGLLIFSLSVFVSSFLVAALLVFYSLILKSSQANLEQESSSLRGKISALSKEKETLLITSERLSTLRKIIASRKNLDVRASSIVSLIPDDFGIDAIKGDSKLISLTLSSPNLSDFDSLLEEKITDFTKDKNLKIVRINVGSFNQKSSQYSLSLDFYFTSAKNTQ